LLNTFYKIIRLPLGVIDLKGNILVSVGWQDLCTSFHRVHPDTRKNCLESDIYLTQNIPRGEFRAYKCKNNLWDIATPVYVKGQHVGNLFIGQLFFDDEPLNQEIFRMQAQKYGFDETRYMSALEKVPRCSKEFVYKAMDFFVQMASQISHLAYSNFELNPTLQERNSLIEQLSERESYLRLLTENMLDMISQIDLQGKLQFTIDFPHPHNSEIIFLKGGITAAIFFEETN